MTYNHFEQMEFIAGAYKPIGHTAKRKRFYRAFGIEDLIELRQELNKAEGTILIAIDGCESDTSDTGADALFGKDEYSFIVAIETKRDDPDTIFAATSAAKDHANQIVLRLYHTLGLRSDFTQQGIGPIGDNFYGVIVSFRVDRNPGKTNPDLWA